MFRLGSNAAVRWCGAEEEKGQGEYARFNTKTKRKEGNDGPVDGSKLTRTHMPPSMHLGVRMLVCASLARGAYTLQLARLYM